MTEKQKMFAHEYLIDLDGKKAAERAGYSKKTAPQVARNLLKIPEINEYIKAKIKAKHDELIASSDEVLMYLTRVMRREEQEDIITKDGIVSAKAKISEANKAADMLGKYYQMFSEKINISSTGGMAIKIVDDIPKK